MLYLGLWHNIPRKRSPPWMLLLLKFFLKGPLILLIILIGPGLVLLYLHPLNNYFTSKSLIWNLILQIITFFLAYVLSGEVVKSAVAFLLVGLIVMQSISQGASLLREILKFKSRNRGALFPGEIRLYREFQVWNQYINAAFCYRSVPPLLFCGVCIIVCSIYGTIRMYVSLPIFVYALLPLTAGVALAFQFALLPQAAKGYEKSREFVAFARKQCTVKWERKVAKSFRPIGARCGPFGMISNKWTVRVGNAVTDSTVTLLLTI